MTGREIDARSSVRVVTANDLITARGLPGLSLKARKLLYIAISQCRKTDEEFSTYNLPAAQFAQLMGVAATNVYQAADSITDELMKLFVKFEKKGKHPAAKKRHVFFEIYCDEAQIIFTLHKDMMDLLLGLKRDFTQPLLQDFLHMNSPYSMAIWHLMQREMHSQKPGVTNVIEFDLTVNELREVTGCETKLRQIGQFKERVLDKALREIRDNCGVSITYDNIKEGRIVTGFHFKAVSEYHVDLSEIPPNVVERTEFKTLSFKRQRKSLSQEEELRYQELLSIYGDAY